MKKSRFYNFSPFLDGIWDQDFAPFWHFSRTFQELFRRFFDDFSPIFFMYSWDEQKITRIFEFFENFENLGATP